MSTSTWGEDLGHLGAVAKDDIGGASARGASVKEDEGGVGMTIISSSLAAMGFSLDHGIEALIDVDGPLREGLGRGFLAMAIFWRPD